MSGGKINKNPWLFIKKSRIVLLLNEYFNRIFNEFCISLPLNTLIERPTGRTIQLDREKIKLIWLGI